MSNAPLLPELGWARIFVNIFWGKGYQIFCDNFFTSIDLSVDLLEHGNTLIGTTQPNGVDFPKQIVNKGAKAGFCCVYNKIHEANNMR